MLDAGVVGYVLKQNASGDLIHAIRGKDDSPFRKAPHASARRPRPEQ